MGVEMEKARLVCVALLVLISCGAARAVVIGHQACHGTMGRCQGVEEEWAINSEIGRRLLQTTMSGSIGYKALGASRVPHQTMQRGNSYTRGCNANYHCRNK